MIVRTPDALDESSLHHRAGLCGTIGLHQTSASYHQGEWRWRQ